MVPSENGGGGANRSDIVGGCRLIIATVASSANAIGMLSPKYNLWL